MGTDVFSDKLNLAMHIAVCDDSVGDRKQMERLLNRESDARAKETGVFYIDSYGNADAVMQSPMLYDAFFIDMVSKATDGTELAKRLLNAGVTAPIVLCISSINYAEAFRTDSNSDFQNIFFLNKPIKKGELSDMLDMCIDRKSRRVLTIELRGEKETRYVTEDDIVSARLEGNYVCVLLRDGSHINVLSTLENFYSQLAVFSHYAAVTSKSMVNITFISKVTLFQVTMTDGTQLRTTPSYSRSIKTAFRQYTQGL